MTTNNGNDETQVGGTPPAAPDEPSDSRKLWLIGLGVLLIGILIGVGVAVAGGGDDNKQAGDGTSTSSSSASSTTLESTSTTASSVTSTTNGGGGSTSPTQPSDDPKINSFNVGSNPATCSADNPAGPFDSPTDPYNFVISWSASNATQTVLTIDGGGPFGTYGPSGSVSHSYGCQTASHTFTIVVSGPNGPDTTRTITLQINKGP